MTVHALQPVAAHPSAAAWEPPLLQTPEDIARLQPAFVRALGRDFDLAALAGRLCPVQLESGEVAVFAVKDYTLGDQIDEVERMVQAQGYRLAQVPRY